jgi:hypothetical protein
MMPKNETPCGARYSLIFRYITEALMKPGAIDKQTTAERKKRNLDRISEYDVVQAAFHKDGYSGVREALRARAWESK